MTEKQYKYILDICPQTITIGNRDFKPSLEKEKTLKLSNEFTQLLIKYGKLYKAFSNCSDLIAIYSLQNNWVEVEEMKEVYDKIVKEMNKLEKLMSKYLGD